MYFCFSLQGFEFQSSVFLCSLWQSEQQTDLSVSASQFKGLCCGSCLIWILLDYYKSFSSCFWPQLQNRKVGIIDKSLYSIHSYTICLQPMTHYIGNFTLINCELNFRIPMWLLSLECWLSVNPKSLWCRLWFQLRGWVWRVCGRRQAGAGTPATLHLHGEKLQLSAWGGKQEKASGEEKEAKVPSWQRRINPDSRRQSRALQWSERLIKTPW